MDVYVGRMYTSIQPPIPPLSFFSLPCFLSSLRSCIGWQGRIGFIWSQAKPKVTPYNAIICDFARRECTPFGDRRWVTIFYWYYYYHYLAKFLVRKY
jgi:hypothetical protein